jgi:hypothetical protein
MVALLLRPFGGVESEELDLPAQLRQAILAKSWKNKQHKVGSGSVSNKIVHAVPRKITKAKFLQPL